VEKREGFGEKLLRRIRLHVPGNRRSLEYGLCSRELLFKGVLYTGLDANHMAKFVQWCLDACRGNGARSTNEKLLLTPMPPFGSFGSPGPTTFRPPPLSEARRTSTANPEAFRDSKSFIDLRLTKGSQLLRLARDSIAATRAILAADYLPSAAAGSTVILVGAALSSIEPVS
jgi:hypothetical protein